MLDENVLDRIEAKLDNLHQDFNDYRVHVESRLSKVEVRSSLLGAVTGAVAGAISHFFGLGK